jgi:hypothetical protein
MDEGVAVVFQQQDVQPAKETSAPSTPPSTVTITAARPMPIRKQAATVDVAPILGIALVVVPISVWLILRAQNKKELDKALRDQAEHYTAKLDELHARLGDVRTDSPDGQAVLSRHQTEAEYAKVQLAIAQAELASREKDAAAIANGTGMGRAELDALVGRKMSLEIDLLTTQIELARRDLAMRGDQLDYHDAMMAKAKLETESLKLHIREQHKRLDDL